MFIYLSQPKGQNITMNKPTKKREKYNEIVLEALKNKYGFTINYIQKCLRGDRTGIMPDEIIKDYYKMLPEVNQKIQEIKENIV